MVAQAFENAVLLSMHVFENRRMKKIGIYLDLGRGQGWRRPQRRYDREGKGHRALSLPPCGGLGERATPDPSP